MAKFFDDLIVGTGFTVTGNLITLGVTSSVTGSLGVGLSSPTYKLHVVADDGAATTTNIAYFNHDANSGIDIRNSDALGTNLRFNEGGAQKGLLSAIGASFFSDTSFTLSLGSTSTFATLTIIDADATNSRFTYAGIDGGRANYSGVTPTDGMYFEVYDANPRARLSANSHSFVMNNFGIGTSNPSAKLHVDGDTLTTGTASISGNLIVDTNTLYVDATSNEVGIGTSTPTKTLDVAGDVLITNTATASPAFIVNAGTTSNAIYVEGTGRVGIGRTPRSQFELDVLGDIGATTKSFIIDHPTKPGMNLRHGSLEGPEHAVYVRGKLTNENTISLPDYWTGLVDESTITVTLTPIGGHQELYVDEIGIDEITIGGENVNCFYLVHAERKDVDKMEVEY